MLDKILCLGNNSEATDHLCSDMASRSSITNHGLIDRNNLDLNINSGIYHTSLADLSPGEILKLSGKFTKIVMLDQPRQEWSHWKLLQTTYKTMINLESSGHDTYFRENANIKTLEKMQKMVANNTTWCIYPWINLVTKDDSGMYLCARSSTRISEDCSIQSWSDSLARKAIQKSMLRGDRLPTHCKTCYDYENKGIESYRQYESLEWCNQLGIEDFSDLDKITKPKYYEIFWSNKCNLKCRGCCPSRSSAIETEFKKHGVIGPLHDIVPDKFSSIDIVDILGLDKASRVYVTGGEPAIMPETLEFMDRCIKNNRVDFELTMSTNGVKFPRAFLDASRHFPNFNLSFSLDGYREVNDYWRSGAKWDSIVDNMHLAKSMGHNVTINTVPGIYNVTNLHRLLEWLDREFPMTAIYMQINHVGIQSAYNHPNRNAVINSMKRCQQTSVYWSNGKSCRSAIDSILEYYEKNHAFSRDDLRAFFKFNDRLDEIRRVRLGDCIPELEACRSFLE